MNIIPIDSPEAKDNLIDLVLTKEEASKLVIILDCAMAWAESGELGDFACMIYNRLHPYTERKGDYKIKSHLGKSFVIIKNGWVAWEASENEQRKS